jgi:hypothetical protein
MKISAKSAKYEIRKATDTKTDELIYLELYSYKQNKVVKTCHAWEIAYFFQYDITVPQMNYLNKIQKEWEKKSFKPKLVVPIELKIFISDARNFGLTDKEIVEALMLEKVE